MSNELFFLVMTKKNLFLNFFGYAGKYSLLNANEKKNFFLRKDLFLNIYLYYFIQNNKKTVLL